jgi:hypothetical protein
VATITPALAERPTGTALTGTLRSTTEVAVAAGGDSVVLSGNGIQITLRNADASSHTITLNSVQAPSWPGGGQGADADPAMPVVAGAARTFRIPAADFDRYRNLTTGMLDLTYSASGTSCFLEVYQY